MLRDLDLDGVDLSGSRITNSFFNESSLVGADLSNADLRGCVFFRANLSGANLQGSILDDCYMKEITHSAGTVWPGLFNPETGSGSEGGDTPAAGIYLETFLCSPRWTPRSDILGRVAAATSIVPHGETGTVARKVNEQLLANLALNIHQAFLTGDLYTENRVFGIFDEQSLEGWLADDADNLMYTLCVLMLLSVGMRFDEIGADGHMRVTFRPVKDMKSFAEGPAVKLLCLVFDTFCGAEHELESATKELLEIEPESWFFGHFLGRPGTHVDLSNAHGVDARVSMVAGPQPERAAGDTLLESLVHFLYFARFSMITDDEDEHETDDDWHAHEIELTWATHLANLVIALMGIQEIRHETTGVLSAVISPPMDLLEVLLNEGMAGDDIAESETVALGLPGDHEVRLVDHIARPTLGIFAPVAG